jgi:hypothetical protein
LAILPIEITVYEYEDVTPDVDDLIKEHRVSAYCVGGAEGIRAYFIKDNMFCEAIGDDGHWWLVSKSHVDWFERIKEAINSVKLP